MHKSHGKRKDAALFDNHRESKPSRLPQSVVRELVETFGVDEWHAKKLGWNDGFAMLYRLRNGGPVTPEQRAEHKRDLAGRMEACNRDELTPTGELVDLTAEALSLLDEKTIRRVVKGIHNLLLEKAA